MSRRKSKFTTKNSDVIIYTTDKEEPKSVESLMNNLESKEIEEYSNESKPENEEIIENEEEINNQIKENKLIRIYNDLPNIDYRYIFDKEYLTYFNDDDKLKDFENAMEIIRSNKIKDIRIINAYKKKIRIDIIENFNAELMKIYFDFIRLFEEFKDFVDKKEKEGILSRLNSIYQNNKLVEKAIHNNFFKSNKNIFKFDNLCCNIIRNLHKKAGYSYFSQTFFGNMLPKKWMNFNRFYMERIYIDIENNESNFKFSIINCENAIHKEYLSNLINLMIVFKNEVEKYELELKDLRNKKVAKEEEEAKKNKEKELENQIESFLGTLTDYFEMLLDYIFFEDNFMYEDDNIYMDIYDKFISYYGELTALNKNNYSYIYEYNYNKISNKNIKWTEYIKEEYKTNGLKILHKAVNSLDKFFGDKTPNKNVEKENEQKIQKFGENQYKKTFYDILFMILESNIVSYQEIENQPEIKKIILIINSIIKVILSEGDKDFIFNIYEIAYKEGDSYDLKRKKRLRNIRKKIIKDNIFHINDLRSILQFEYVNSLIVLLESFGEYKNKYFKEIMFEKSKNNKTYFEELVDEFKCITNWGNKDNRITLNTGLEKNTIILFNSLTNCIIEYIESSNANDIIYGRNINEHINNDKFLVLYFEFVKIISNEEVLQFHLFKLENYLLFYFHLIKNLDYEKVKIDVTLKEINRRLCGAFILSMDCCFQKLLEYLKLQILDKPNGEIDLLISDTGVIIKNYEVQYDRYSHDYNDEKFFRENNKIDISPAVDKLCQKYKENEFDKSNSKIIKELLELIFLSYKIFFNLNEIHNYLFGSLLYINNNKDYFEKSKQSLKELSEMEQIRIMLLFSFLQEICDIIEIKLEKEKNNDEKVTNDIKVINFLSNEYLNLSEYSIYYFENQIDFADRESKLISIYNFIECLIYDIKMNKRQITPSNCLKKILIFIDENILNYYLLEIVNMLVFIVYNILLTIFYKKSRSESEEQYNQIDNRNNFYSILVMKIIHIICLVVIIIHWWFYRRKIDLLYSKMKLANEYHKENEKLSMSEKANIIKRKNYDIYDFFPENKENKIKMKRYIRDSSCFKKLKNIGKKIIMFYANTIKDKVLSLGTIFPFLLSLLCLGLSFISQIFLVAPLFLIFNLFESLQAIFLLILSEQFHSLLLLIIYILLILYIFSWISFFFLPKMFTYEAVDKNNELVSQNYFEESICSSSVPCILYFMNFGLSTEGSVDMNLISFKSNMSYYLLQFFFEIFLFLFIHMILFNIVLATIGNGYDKMKEKIDKKSDDEKNVCFICDKTRNDCIEDNEDFDEHLEMHNKWKYIIYIINILQKNKEIYTYEEYFVWKQLEGKNIDWFPKYEKKAEENKSDGVINLNNSINKKPDKNSQIISTTKEEDEIINEKDMLSKK